MGRHLTISVDANLESTKLGRLKLQSANDALAIESQNIQVQNSRVAYRDPEAIATLGHLNAGDMDFSQLNADIPVFSFKNDTLYLQANSLTGNDKSGLQIHSLRAITRVTPGSIELKEALATMNRTSLDGDVVLYKNDKASFDRMKVDLRHVKGYVDDLDRAIPPQKNPALAKFDDMPFEVSGNISGWLQNLQMENMRFLAGQATVAYFRGSVQNLTESDKLGMNLNITRLESNRADLLRFMSLGDTPMDSLLAQPLPAYVNVSGDVSGRWQSWN